jgi:hypothetical protein
MNATSQTAPIPPAKQVAIVVVHGIADQQPGQTVRELAHLLCHGGNGAPRYVQGELSEVLIPVAKLAPSVAVDVAQTRSSAANNTQDKSQAPQRNQPGAPSGFYQAQQCQVPPQAKPTASKLTAQANTEIAQGDAQDTTQDLGIQLNDYLLANHQLSQADALYESTKISLQRRADSSKVDLYEMYWADLSRLGGSGVLMLSALYQLFFHLSTLAADIVDQASISVQGRRSWHLLQRLHAWMAWLMKGPSFLVQLALLLLVLFGTTISIPEEQRPLLLAVLYIAGGLALTVLAALAWLRGSQGWQRWCLPLLLAAAVVVCFATAYLALREWYFAYLYFASGALVTGLVGAYLVERYSRLTQGVRVLGHMFVLATLVLLGIESAQLLPYMTTVYEWTLTVAMSAGEWLFAFMLLLWAVFYSIEFVAIALGLWLQRNADERIKASLHTARLCLVISTGMFVVLNLVLWSIISSVVGFALNEIGYAPQVFGDGYFGSAENFLDQRIRGLGGFFTPLIFVSGLLGFACLLVLAPALLEELSPSSKLDELGTEASNLSSARLGAWLGGGLALLDKWLRVLVPVGALAGAALFLAFVLKQFAISMEVETGLVGWLTAALDPFEGETLVAAGKWFAGGAVTVVALGSRFTQTLGRLRVVLDAVLDVDNYFADPPNHQPPRARIYARYASLLRYLHERGYQRIVIVSHSQGTVISAELLHYLHVKQRLTEVVGSTPLALVTLGSPLRDLYAKRFPLLYAWMGNNACDFANALPRAADIGACEWVNASRSGDYVGRALWAPMDASAHFQVATLDAAGNVSAQRAGDRSEFSLGAGAHTHYFSTDAVALAVEIDRLVGGSSARN